MYLRRAAQRVCILHARVTFTVAGDDGRAGENACDVAGAGGLTKLRAQRLQLSGERPVRAEKALDSHRCGDVGQPGEFAEVVERQAQHAQDAVGAIDERKSLLRTQPNRSEARSLEGAGRRLGCTVCPHFTFANHGKCAVAEGCKIAAGTQRAVLPNDRGDARIEHRQLQLHDFRPCAGERHRQAARTQEQHRPHDFNLDRVAHTRCMRTYEGDL